MNRKLIPVLLLGSLSLAAQTDATRPSLPAAPIPAKPQPPDTPQLALRVEGAAAKLSAPNANDKFFGVLLVSADNRMLDFNGLPPLLATTIVVGAGSAVGGMIFDLHSMPQLPFTVWVQGVGLLDNVIVASNVVAVGGTGAGLARGVPAAPDADRPPTRKPIDAF
jgi:hypothetical protein